jgi:hypothetical protein
MMTDIRTDEFMPECDEDGMVTLEAGRHLLDESARLNLNMSGTEFLTAWDEGRILNPDTLAVQQVASLIPFAR